MYYLTTKQAMDYLQIKSPKTFNGLVKRGLPVITMGKSLRVSKTAIDEFMKKHTSTAESF